MRELAQRIVNSGMLGRSRTYRDILNYLVECSIVGQPPKEMAIAVDVLGRDTDFDAGRDSVVRVHLHHLRNKLRTYFEKHGSHEPWRLEIPKGQYVVVPLPNKGTDAAKPSREVNGDESSPQRRWLPWLTVTLAALLAISLVSPPLTRLTSSPLEEVRSHPPWVHILDDQTPIRIVAGDYYIFGERDRNQNITRMIRDFDINSSTDLQNLLIARPELFDRYYDLNLSYLPTGVAAAMTRIMPLLYDQSNRISVSTVSRLSASDLADSHIIYIGYISGLGMLQDLMFASSAFRVGATYDELIQEGGAGHFVSDSGTRTSAEEFHDFGMISTFTSPRGHRIILVAGMRDAGLESVAEQISSISGLGGVEKEIAGAPDWEALYEVYGYDQTGLNAALKYAGGLGTDTIWSRE